MLRLFSFKPKSKKTHTLLLQSTQQEIQAAIEAIRDTLSKAEDSAEKTD